MPPSRRFAIASITKTLTALVAARLGADNVVDWNAPTGFRSAGEFTGGSGGTGEPLTLSNLLRHTARLPNELHPRHWRVGQSLTFDDIDNLAGRAAVVDLPPLTWHYSNLGYALIARVLEDATGESFPALVQRLLLAPLGMHDTSFPEPEEAGRRVAMAAAAAGGLWSTMEDLVTLGRALDGQRLDVVTVPMLASLFDGAVPEHPLRGRLASGLRLQPAGRYTCVVATGTVRGTTTCLTVWPRRGMSVLVADAAAYTHSQLWEAAMLWWRRPAQSIRTWWLDAQPLDELRTSDGVDLLLRETAWPFPYFSGTWDPEAGAASEAASGADGVEQEVLTGVDWQRRPVTLTRTASKVAGPYAVLTADASDSAFIEEPRV